MSHADPIPRPPENGDALLQVDAYLRGELDDARRDAFEARLLWDAELRAELAAAEAFGRGLRRAAAEDQAAVAGAATVGLWAALRRRPLQAIAAALVLGMIALLPAGLAWRQLDDARDELAAARRHAAAVETERDRLATTGEDLRHEAERRRSLEARLEALAAEGERLRAAAAPAINLPILTLAAVRSGDAPPAELTWGEAERAVFALEVPSAAADAWTVTLRDDAGDVLWRGDGLRPDELGTLVLTLPASLLPAGTYELEARPAGGGPARRFPLRVTAP